MAGMTDARSNVQKAVPLGGAWSLVETEIRPAHLKAEEYRLSMSSN